MPERKRTTSAPCPPVTVGTAVPAAFVMFLCLLRQEEGYVVRGFFRASFRRSTCLWLPLLGILIVSGGDLLVRSWLPQFRFLLTAAAVQALAPLDLPPPGPL